MTDPQHDVRPSASTAKAGADGAANQAPHDPQKTPDIKWPRKFGQAVDWTIATAERHWIVSLLSLFIGSCMFMTRDRTVTWEEEVPLNTGETIVVKRTGRYVDYDYDLSQNRLGYKPDPKTTMEFEYKGKRYSFSSEAGVMLLAIGSDGIPNFAANPDNYSWQFKNKYYCTSPYYVQFKPDPDRTTWTWPSDIENWLYGLPANLMPWPVEISDDGKKFTAIEVKERLSSVFRGSPRRQSIDLNHSGSNICPRRN